MGLTTWTSPNGQRFTMHRDAVPLAEPFFKRLNELHPQYQSLGGHAVRPMRTLDGRNLGGLSSHATGYTLDVKAPDPVLRQLAQEFPQVRWGGNFKSHYDPVHFEFKPGAAPIGAAPSASPAPGGGLSGASPPMALSNAYVPPQEQPGYLDRVLNSPLFMMGASVLGAPNIGTGLMQGSQAASQNAMSRERLANERQMMPLRQMLMQSQVEQAQQERQMAPLKMQLMEAQVKKSMEPATTDDIREFQYAKNNGFAGGFQDWMKQKRDMNGQTAQQITWGTDDKGNYVPMQASRDGKLVASQLPPNVTPVPAEVLAYRKAAATEQGQGAGKAKVDLPAVRTNANLMLDAIEAIEKDDNLPAMTEGLSAWLPNVSPQSRASKARIDQVQGKAFLQAYAGLRGGGAITEAEGAKATQSLSRLQELPVGTPEYRKALADLRKEVQALVALAEQKAAAGEPNVNVRGAPQAAPAPAGVPAGSYVFDPATGQLRPR